jgi:hypothetical protein
MGYTHYFAGLTATPAVIADARKIIEASPVTICGPLGQGLPVLDDGNWSTWAAGVDLYEQAVRPLTVDEKKALELDVEAMRPARRAAAAR